MSLSRDPVADGAGTKFPRSGGSRVDCAVGGQGNGKSCPLSPAGPSFVVVSVAWRLSVA